ncbi:MAG: hypothetical protein WCE21_01555 [Candidatus Babeliales bacterium]
MDHSYGIVLQAKLSKQNKILLLDKSHGKIVAIPFCKKQLHLSPGTMLEYVLSQKIYGFCIEQISIYDAPLTLGRNDILFLHTVLELCLYGLVENQSAVPIFADFYGMLYTHSKQWNNMQKLVFILRFLWNTGMYAEEAVKKYPHIPSLFVLPLELMIHKAVECKYEELRMCIQLCLQVHPQREKFKVLVG